MIKVAYNWMILSKTSCRVQCDIKPAFKLEITMISCVRVTKFEYY